MASTLDMAKSFIVWLYELRSQNDNLPVKSCYGMMRLKVLHVVLICFRLKLS